MKSNLIIHLQHNATQPPHCENNLETHPFIHLIHHRFDEAMDVYDSIIRQDETNSTARKRKVAVLRGQGRMTDAIKELTDYLKLWVDSVMVLWRQWGNQWVL